MTQTSWSERAAALALTAALLVSVSGCDSDPKVEEADVDLVGSWELRTTLSSNTCGLPNGTARTETIYLDGIGAALTVINFDGQWGTARVSESEVTFAGSEGSDDFGCPATLLTEGSGEATSSRIAGSLTTTVTFDQGSCDGNTGCELTTSFVMTRLEETDCLNRAVFGDPVESEYVLPFPVGSSYEVYQSYCWRTGGHRNQLAYDFEMPIGAGVTAARGGVVKDIREDSPDDGQGVGEHNYILIEHDDGTVALYAHLQQDGVAVSPGETVVMGQSIAASGNSGYSGTPHLHFGVYQHYPPTEGLDVPVTFRNGMGPLDENGGLIRHQTYQAAEYQPS